MSILGGIFDSLGGKNKYIARINSQTVNYSMFMLGKNPNIIIAMLIALVVSVGAAASEEVFFRGLVQNLFGQIIPAPAALIFTSVIFGVAHLPLDNINFVLETLLGGAFGALYITSGYNLAVPVIAHVVYDFTTLLGSWIWGRNEIRRRIQEQTTQVSQSFSCLFMIILSLSLFIRAF